MLSVTTQGNTKVIFGTGIKLIVESGMFDICAYFHICKFYTESSVFYDYLVNTLCNLTLKHGIKHNIQLCKYRKYDKNINKRNQKMLNMIKVRLWMFYDTVFKWSHIHIFQVISIVKWECVTVGEYKIIFAIGTWLYIATGKKLHFLCMSQCFGWKLLNFKISFIWYFQWKKKKHSIVKSTKGPASIYD